MAQRKFSTDFTGGTISCVLTLEGYKADELQDLLDNNHRVVSKQVHKELIPHLNHLMVDEDAVLPGSDEVTETVKAEVLNHVVTLEIEVKLVAELTAPHDEMIKCLIVNAVAAAVIKDMISRLSGRLYNETSREYLEKHPERARGGVRIVSLEELFSTPGGPMAAMMGHPGRGPFQG